MIGSDLKVLVTGANGFIGARLCNDLKQQGYQVRTLSRSPNTHSDDHWLMDLAIDQCPAGLLHGVDAVFHLAGKAHALAETSQDVAEYRNINTQGTCKLLEAAQQADVKHFVFFSSIKAVGDSPEQLIDETFNMPADTPYGQSKYLAEQLVLHGGYIPHPVVIRPCMVYGNTEKGNLPRMINAVQRGVFPPLPETNNRRSMVHVEDVVRAALLAVENPLAAGQIYIVSDEQQYSTRQIYDWIREALGKPPQSWSMPGSVLRGLAKSGDVIGYVFGRRFSFDSDSLQKLTASAQYSSAKITRELGFHPQFTLKQSLPEIVRFLNSAI